MLQERLISSVLTHTESRAEAECRGKFWIAGSSGQTFIPSEEFVACDL